MSVVKIVLRVFLFSFFFFLLLFLILISSKILNKDLLIETGVYEGVLSDFNYPIVEYIKIFLLIFIPFTLSSLLLYFSNKYRMKVMYWIIALVPICVIGWFTIYISGIMGSNLRLGTIIYILLPMYLFLAFYYNFKLINKESEKR